MAGSCVQRPANAANRPGLGPCLPARLTAAGRRNHLSSVTSHAHNLERMHAIILRAVPLATVAGISCAPAALAATVLQLPAFAMPPLSSGFIEEVVKPGPVGFAVAAGFVGSLITMGTTAIREAREQQLVESAIKRQQELLDSDEQAQESEPTAPKTKLAFVNGKVMPEKPKRDSVVAKPDSSANGAEAPVRNAPGTPSAKSASIPKAPVDTPEPRPSPSTSSSQPSVAKPSVAQPEQPIQQSRSEAVAEQPAPPKPQAKAPVAKAPAAPPASRSATPPTPAPEASTAAPAAFVEVVYATGWSSPTMHMSAGGGEWTTAAMEKCDGGMRLRLDAPEDCGDAPLLEFVITDGEGAWDKPPTGDNYKVFEVGSFRLADGSLTKM